TAGRRLGATRRRLGPLHRLPHLAHGLAPCPQRAQEQQRSHACKCLLHAHHLLVNVCGSGAHYLRSEPRLPAASQRAAAASTRLAAASARREASSARGAAAFACSTSFRPAQPLGLVLTTARAAMLAPNSPAFLPPHLLCPEESRGGLGKATPFVSQKECARNQASDGSGKASLRHP